jgi:hypothetical protein
VAGPIPGVTITAPQIVDPPVSGKSIAVDQQPITLSVGNATTTGVRPLNYLFEVATDAGFTNKVFTRDGITPGDGGKTNLRLPDPLATGRSYFWRARAQDGANTGPYSLQAPFSVYTPIVINAPTPVSPTANSTIDNIQPNIVFTDSTHSGPVGTIAYYLELSDSYTFANKIAAWNSGEQAGQTTTQVPTTLNYSAVYYWHVRAYDPSTSGPFSVTYAFATPAPPPPPPPVAPPPSSGGGSGGGGGNFNFANVTFVGGSPNVSGWAQTSQITVLGFDPANGIFHIEHTKQGQWPPVPFGDVTQESTVWAFFRINGQWYTSGGERLRPGQTDKGLGNPSQMGPGWYYGGQWAPMTNYIPPVGDPVGFMVTAGDDRVGNNSIVQERTNVVFISMPPDNVRSFYPPFAGTPSGKIQSKVPTIMILPPPVIRTPPHVIRKR